MGATKQKTATGAFVEQRYCRCCLSTPRLNPPDDSATIPPVIGSTISHYRITGKLGAGGMGEVYRATDSKLDRDVAIKVMPEEFAENAERVARFEREAKALAKLNHPNIGSIYGFDQHEGKWFLVLELIEGETLSERLRTGPMPVEEALKVFKQIAEALEAAHEKHIVHRDLKPANVKIDPQGRVKVLDFGLAKARFSARPSTDSDAPTADSDGPTITSEFTMPGKVMGTAAYMSPEQSRGQDVDRRTDVWAFGCCLYEVLTGKKPFKGQTASDLLVEILKSDPDFTVIPPETPGEVLSLLRRSLEKDPRRRLRDLGDIALTLEDVTETSRLHAVVRETASSSDLSSPKESQGNLWWKLLALAGIAAAVVMTIVVVQQNKAPSQIRSLAVLPFENLTGDEQLDETGVGLSEGISFGLKQSRRFAMMPRWAQVKGYRDSPASLKEIADKLEVDAVLHGTIDGPLTNLQVNVELTLGISGESPWTQSFSAKGPGIATLENDVALAVLQHLNMPVENGQQELVRESGTTNALAYAAFRRGLRNYFTLTQEGVAQARVEFEKTKELDPNFVNPLVMLAESEWILTIREAGDRGPLQSFKEARKRLQVAIDLAPDHPAVRWQEGWIAMAGDWDWLEARQAFGEAFADGSENPDYFDGLAWYNDLVEGDHDEAIDTVMKGLELDPENEYMRNARVFMKQDRGSFQEALSLHQENLVREPKDWGHLIGVAICYAELGEDKVRAVKAAEEAVRLSNENSHAQLNLADVLARFGDVENAKSILKEMEDRANTTFVSSVSIAIVHARLGNWDAAFRWLESGFEGKEGFAYLRLRNHRILKLMGDQPRYWDLVDRMKFPALPIQHPFHEKEQVMRYGRTASSGSTVADTPNTTSTELDENTIVMLPLKARGKEDADLVFAEGLTDVIKTQLQRSMR